MPNLTNADSAGNSFFNYITPAIPGEASNLALNLPSFLVFAGWAAQAGYYSFNFRPPAPGIETRTGTDWRIFLGNYTTTQANPTFNVVTNNANGTQVIINSQWTGNAASTTDYTYMVANDYAFSLAVFTSSARTTLRGFVYAGYLREPSFVGSTYPQGCILLNSYANVSADRYIRPQAPGTTAKTILASAADTITSPPIVCTTGTDPGDGSETFTDVVIRDAASPNNPVGKLWNCIDMPATCNVGELWKNTGAYDADDSASEQDVYLCVMPWGTRKLGMRVWTENVN